jgi:hypothetical protein
MSNIDHARRRNRNRNLSIPDRQSPKF